MTNTTFTNIAGLPEVRLTTEKGGVRPAIREQIKEQAVNHINLDGFTLVNGVYTKAIAVDKDGEPIYVSVAVTVGKTLPSKRTGKAKTKVETEEVVKLFID